MVGKTPCTDVPDEIMELIFKAQRYTVEVNGKGDGMTYEELPYAYAAALDVGPHGTVDRECGECVYCPGCRRSHESPSG